MSDKNAETPNDNSEKQHTSSADNSDTLKASEDMATSESSASASENNNDAAPPEALNNPIATQAPRPVAAPSSGGSASTILSTFAVLLGLVAAGGGYFLWGELMNVQQRASSIAGVDQSTLDKLEANLKESLQAQTDKVASDLKTLIAQSQGDLEGKISTKTQDAQQGTATLTTDMNKSIADIRNSVTGVENLIKQQETKTESAITTAKSELQANLATLDSTVAELRGSFGELRQQVNDRVQTTEETQAALQTTVQEQQQVLQQALSQNQVHWTLAEVEQMLGLANRQILLEQNTVKAITTLRTADQRLQALSDPALLQVREALEKDIAALSKVNVPDIQGTAITLQRLASEVPMLQSVSSIQNAEKTADATPAANSTEDASVTETSLAAASGLATAAWDSLRGLVVLRHNGEVVAPLLPPEQNFFLQQNLTLKLETARIALLRQDDEIFHSSLATASDWTAKYFDANADSTKQFLAEIKALDALNLNPEIPDISDSLRILKTVKPNLS